MPGLRDNVADTVVPVFSSLWGQWTPQCASNFLRSPWVLFPFHLTGPLRPCHLLCRDNIGLVAVLSLEDVVVSCFLASFSLVDYGVSVCTVG